MPVRNVYLIRLITAGIWFAMWQALASSGLLYQDIVPGLTKVALAVAEQLVDADFYSNLGVTSYEVIIGFVIGSIVGVLVGLLLGTNRYAGKVVEPYINIVATTPKIVFLPIIMLMVGAGPLSKIVLGISASFFPVVLNTTSGVRSLPLVLAKVGKSFHLSRRQMIAKIYLPALSRPIITGMRLGLGLTITVVLLGEIIVANAGLGFMASNYYNNFQIPQLYSVLILIFFLAMLINGVMSRFEGKIR